MTSNQDALLRLASRYSAVGLPIFPINPLTDRPRVKWGREASCERAQIEYWVSIWPDSLWGIAVPPRFIVVDIDVKHGHDGFADFERLAGCHPDALATWQATTPSGGRHVWFDTDGHRFFRNTVGEIAPGLDTKTFRLPRDEDPSDEGGHGMVKAPPGPGRRWIAGEREPMKAGQWLRALFVPRMTAPHAPAGTTATHTIQGLIALTSLTDKIRNAPVGERDKTRNKFAYTIGGLVGGGELEESDAWDAVLQAARDAIDGLGQEARRKEKYLRAAFDKGCQAPTNCHSLIFGPEENPAMRRDMSLEEFERAFEAERSGS
jgi:hypothetical protein